MSYAVESFVVISAAVAIFGGLLAFLVVSVLGRDTTKIKMWVGRMAAVLLFLFFSWGTFMCYKNAFVLSRRGTPAIAHAHFKRSYVPFHRVREVFVYDMVFDGHKIEEEYPYPLKSAEVRVVYDPSEPQHFMIGEASGSALQLFRSDMKGDFGFIFVWPVCIIAAVVLIYFSWRGQPPAVSFPARRKRRT
jgi:hypothetical protein